MLDIPRSNLTINQALRRIGIQRALLSDLTGMLYGDDYEWAFSTDLIDGEWKWAKENSRGSSYHRRFRNGNIRTDNWDKLRLCLIKARRDRNMTQDGNLIGRDFGERLVDVRLVGLDAAQLFYTKTVVC